MCVWVHLGADDSLGGSLYVGRQTKECRSVILWEILYYATVVLERHTPKQVTHKELKRENVSMVPTIIMVVTYSTRLLVAHLLDCWEWENVINNAVLFFIKCVAYVM